MTSKIPVILWKIYFKTIQGSPWLSGYVLCHVIPPPAVSSNHTWHQIWHVRSSPARLWKVGGSIQV